MFELKKPCSRTKNRLAPTANPNLLEPPRSSLFASHIVKARPIPMQDPAIRTIRPVWGEVLSKNTQSVEGRKRIYVKVHADTYPIMTNIANWHSQSNLSTMSSVRSTHSTRLLKKFVHHMAVFTAIRNATSSISGDTAVPIARTTGAKELKKCSIVFWYLGNLKNEQAVCTSMTRGQYRAQIESIAKILMEYYGNERGFGRG